MALAIIGSRYFNDYKFVEFHVAAFINELKSDNKEVIKFVSGGANGVDTLAEQYARENNLELQIFKPDWSVGRAGGPIRNTKIVNSSNYVIAFPGRNPIGTKNKIKKSQKAKKILKVIQVE